MIPTSQFLEYVIQPTLRHMAVAEPQLRTVAAEQLLLGTALMESRLDALKQKGGGPALSVFQIEPSTFEDVYGRYLSSNMKGRATLRTVVRDLVIPAFTPLEQLAGNPFFACAIARVKYWMVPEPMPPAGDIQALGHYWKRHYNTAEGAGNEAMFVDLYLKHVKP